MVAVLKNVCGSTGCTPYVSDKHKQKFNVALTVHRQ
jgi:hypothetical protein